MASITAGAGDRMPATTTGERVGRIVSRVVIYGILLIWTFICLFPIYWTLTTSFKAAPDVMQGHLIPFVDFTPDWKGWRSLGLSPATIFAVSTVREEFLARFYNSLIASNGASSLARCRQTGIRPAAPRGITVPTTCRKPTCRPRSA